MDLILPKRASKITLLPAQNSGKNQPFCVFESWQNGNQQLAKQIRSYDLGIERQPPTTNIRNEKLNASDLIESRVLLRSPNRDWIVIDSNHLLCAEQLAGQREDSAARSKIDNKIRGAHAPSRSRTFSGRTLR